MADNDECLRETRYQLAAANLSAALLSAREDSWTSSTRVTFSRLREQLRATPLRDEKAVKSLVDAWFATQLKYKAEFGKYGEGIFQELVSLYRNACAALVQYCKEVGWPDF